MDLLLSVFALVLSAIVIYQDLKYRAVYWLALTLLLATGLSIAFINYGWNHALGELMINAAFLSIQFVGVCVILWIKHKKLIYPLSHHLGWGDVLFLIAASSFFSPINFIFYYVMGLMIALLTVLIIKLLTQHNLKQIPLAGIMAICLMLCIGSDVFESTNLYDDTLIKEILINR